MRILMSLAAAALLAPLVGCRCGPAQVQFQIAPDMNAAPGAAVAQARPLEIALVTVTPADRKNPAYAPLNPDAPTADSVSWFEQTGGAPAYGLPAAQVHYLSDDQRYGTSVGRWLVWRASEANTYSVTIPTPPGGCGNGAALLIFARYQEADNSIRRQPPVVIRNPGARKEPIVVKANRDSLQASP